MTSTAIYGTVNTTGDDEGVAESGQLPPDAEERRLLPPDKGGWDDWIWHFLKGGTLSDDETTQLQNRLGGTHNSDTFLIHAESVRLIAYALFWLQIACAAIFTKLMISPSQIENSDLKKTFGYNNVSNLQSDILSFAFRR